MKRGWWVCVALAVLGHGAWLAGAYPRPLDRSGLVSSRSTVPRAMVTRRLHPPAPAAEPAPRTAPPPAAPDRPMPRQDMQPIAIPVARPPQDAKPEVREPQPVPADPAPSAPDHADAPASSPQDFETTASEPINDDPDDRYVPRRLLTLPPTALDGVLLTYPRIEFDNRGHYTAILTLFIDETGRVRRIRVDQPGLPEELEGVARRAFQRVRYTPGEVDGQPVPSTIRVEVRFDRLAPSGK